MMPATFLLDATEFAIVNDPTFVGQLFAAVSQKQKRIARGVLTLDERRVRRRQQRREQRHSPIAMGKESERRKNRKMKRKDLELRWLEQEIVWRTLLVKCLAGARTQSDIQYLVGALVESDRAITHCGDRVWPVADKHMLNCIPDWFLLVSPEHQAIYYGDDCDDEEEEEEA